MTAENKIILDSRVEGKKEYQITPAFVESVLTDTEKAVKYDPVDVDEEHDLQIIISVDPTFTQQENIDNLQGAVDALAAVPSEKYINSSLKLMDPTIEHHPLTNPFVLRYTKIVTVTKYTDPITYFHQKWTKDIRDYELQLAEFNEYKELKDRFSATETQWN